MAVVAADDHLGVADADADEAAILSLSLDHHRQQIGAAEELGGEAIGRPAIEFACASDCAQFAVFEDRDAVGEGQRLALVVRDVENGQVGQIRVQPGDLLDHRAADLRVERRQRLIQQEHARTDRERARDRHPLLLAAGQFARETAGILRHADDAAATPRRAGRSGRGRRGAP